MRLRQLEAQVRKLERDRGKGTRRVYSIVWWFGEPSNAPAELDPDGTYYHYYMGDRPSEAEWERHWLSIPVKGGKGSKRRRTNA